ncbi:MAG: lipocalin family protein [Salinimicrobium sediminis]|nr:lipocalin family protein [Salinimicrobium sediminis]
MKKYLLLLAAFGLSLFSSCSDDDDGGETENSIVATWQLTAVNPTIPGWDLSACDENPEITFSTNGSADWTLYDSENDCAAVSSTGDWVKNSDGTYTITIPDVGEFDGTVNFSGANKFTFNTSVQTFPVVLTFEK